MSSSIKDILLKQYGIFFLWFPVLLSIGIGIYFLNIVNLELIFIILVIFSVLFFLPLSHDIKYTIRYITYVISIIIIGYFTIYIHTAYSKSPIIESDLGVIWIRAKIEKIEKRIHGYRFILSELDLWQPERKKFSNKQTPKYIRVEVKTPIEDVKPGNFVSLKAILKPPPQRPVYPNGYEFSKYAYYNQIGAVGYSISKVKLFTYKNRNNEKSITNYIHKIRYSLVQKIRDNLQKTNLPYDSKQIVLALLFGERGAISKKTVNNLRIAGVGHILAISGLHMALIMAGSYFFIRSLFSLFPSIILRCDIKKYSAFFSLLVGFFYLSITSFPISAIRAYIMASIFLLSIIIERNTNPMRPIAMAATIILLIDPYSLLTPSFQMSFSAVIGLVAFFRYFPLKYTPKKSTQKTKFHFITNIKQLFVYFLAIIMSSAVAGLATAPFAIYHFGQTSTYGIIANMVAIPLTTFVIMPFSLFALIFSNFDFSLYMLAISGSAITIMIDNAYYVSSFPLPIKSFVKIPTYYIIGFSIAALWIILWKKPLNYIGIFPCILFVILILIPIKKPDLIISSKGTLFAVNYNEKLAFSSFQKERYTRIQWLRYNGVPKMTRIKDMLKTEPTIFKQYNDNILIKINNKKILFLKDNIKLTKCSDLDYIINLRNNSQICKNKTIVTLKNLKNNGTHLIWLDKKIKILNENETIYMNL